MSDYVLGVDLGTSAVKISAVDHSGRIVAQKSAAYDLMHPSPGFSEQNPEDWVSGTTEAIARLISDDHLKPEAVIGISFSGQMHGLVLLDENNRVLRPAILWNDTRTTAQCKKIETLLGDSFIAATKNRPLEGFTLPKLLWIKENEPEVWAKAKIFLLPKDYVRYRMTGRLATDYSDATGTVLLDVANGTWSKTICETLDIPLSLCPPLIRSIDLAGTVTANYAKISGLTTGTRIFCGAADNAAAAVGTGILSPNRVLSSIGTSGVVLKYENNAETDYHGVLQFEDHAIPDKFYSMGVTLAAGYSLNWFRKVFAASENFSDFIAGASKSTIGANGLLFTPYIVGERTPYADASVRGSFIGIDGTHRRHDFVRAVLEGIVFSFRDIFAIYEKNGSDFDTVVSTGGGSKSPLWLQIQADIFNRKVISLKNEQGPGMGAAMIAAVGIGWFDSLQECAEQFIHFGKVYTPDPDHVKKYQQLYEIYRKVYTQTKEISAELLNYRRNDL